MDGHPAVRKNGGQDPAYRPAPSVRPLGSPGGLAFLRFPLSSDAIFEKNGAMAARLLGALVFVALLGLAVSPVLFDDDVEVPERPAASPAPTPSEEPTPEPEPTDEPSAEPQLRFTDPYPKACLRPVSRPGPFGHVAAYSGGAITIATTGGDVQATIRAPGKIVRPPLAWSPSGTVLAAGPQGLFWRANGDEVSIGDVQHGLVQGRRGTWGWSPLSDCGVHIDETGSLYVAAANPNVVGAGRKLLEDVESFSYSPDGRRLGLVREEGGARSLWIADLARNRLRLVRDFPRPICCISLGGWTPSGDGLLFWAGPGASVMADGWRLESVTIGGERERWGTTVPSGPMERCGDDLIGLVDGDRFGQGARLAVLRSGEEELVLTLTSERIRSFSCSPDDRFFAVQSDARLALFGRDGNFSRYLTNIDTGNGQWGESNPEWGPPRTGILFIRSMHLQTQLWFIAEGGRAEQPVVELKPTGKWNARSLFDWSATPPDGGASG